MAEIAQQLKERLSYFVERVRTFKFTYNQENQGNEVLGETKIMETQVVKERAFVLGAAEDASGIRAKPPEQGGQTN
ncbi:hypothetical protein J5N97_017152 [Dioscorea zingiberensis]|uniref:Uncharacterized protein n=1 Tax=Dioscorea zingiberensis TaxID=325984 RepID=A0A9D5CLE6_9LILI|nr:hypothetical protein J5N97_017152 [Dioscorea zingiberensis]